MQCLECGATVSESDLFCGECGAILSASPPQSEGEPFAAPAPPSPSLYPAIPASPPPSEMGMRNPRARASFILGITSVVLALLSCIPFATLFSCGTPIVGILAIILGSMAKRDIEAKGGLEQDRKKAHQGMIMGIVGTVLFFLFLVVIVMLGIGLEY